MRANNHDLPRKLRRTLAVGTSTISMMMGGAILLGAVGTTLGGPILMAGGALLGAGIGIGISILARSDAPPKD